MLLKNIDTRTFHSFCYLILNSESAIRLPTFRLKGRCRLGSNELSRLPISHNNWASARSSSSKQWPNSMIMPAQDWIRNLVGANLYGFGKLATLNIRSTPTWGHYQGRRFMAWN